MTKKKNNNKEKKKEKKISKQVAIPKGFLFKAVSASIKTSSQPDRTSRPDVALIVSEYPAAAAAVFTTNKLKAAPVKLSIKAIKSGAARAVIVNSGNANACTGAQGLKDAQDTVKVTAKALGLSPKEVLVASTGVIGELLPMDRLINGLLKASLVLDSTVEDVARAIMTTDTYPKVVSRSFRLDGKKVTLTGVAKGSGMIAPNMATMLCFLITDAAVMPKVLDRILRRSVGLSFNRITVDGDCSTNDTLAILANGAAGNSSLKDLRSDASARMQKAVDEVTYELSRMVAKDGEGATKLIEVYIKGAKSDTDAEHAAMAVANSLLVKTAVYGCDANWGRIACAVGYSGAALKEEKINIFFNRVKVVSNGRPTGKDLEAARQMAGDTVKITLDLGLGRGESRALTCDLTEKYIEINAEYRT